MFKPYPSPDLRVLSLGAGRQSSALALMAAHGEFGAMPDVAIFADTGWEPRHVYEQVEFLASPNVLPFPVMWTKNSRRGSSGNIRTDLINRIEGTKSRFAAVPFFTRDEAGERPFGMGRRQCTREYKIDAIHCLIRGIMGVKSLRGKVVEVWKGISLDEIERVGGPGPKWEHCRYPLIEKRMRLGDCIEWLKRHDYPVPGKSSCIGCPYHSNAHWRDMRDNDPSAWDDACAVDDLIRNGGRFGHDGYHQYMHRSCVPLRDADLSTDEDRGQMSLWSGECTGMCGV